MTKKVDRELDLIERLEQENRELKSIKRSLEKRLKKLSRGYKAYLDKDLEEEPLIKAPKEEVKHCWNCSTRTLEVKIVLNRRWRQCTSCDKRTKVKIIP